MVIKHTLKKAQLIIEDVRLRIWIIIFIIWLIAVIIWNYGFPKVSPLADVIVAAMLSLTTTLAHFILKKIRNRKVS